MGATHLSTLPRPSAQCPPQAATKTSNTPSAPEDWSEAEQVQEWVGFVLDDVLEGVDAALDAHKRGGGAALVPDRLPSGTRATVAIGNRESDHEPHSPAHPATTDCPRPSPGDPTGPPSPPATPLPRPHPHLKSHCWHPTSLMQHTRACAPPHPSPRAPPPPLCPQARPLAPTPPPPRRACSAPS